MKEQKGITLIALIITIIVMLILVGVTVNVALNGGLFNAAKEATIKQEIAIMQEVVDTEIVNLTAKNIEEGKDLEVSAKDIITACEMTSSKSITLGTESKYISNVNIAPQGICYILEPSKLNVNTTRGNGSKEDGTTSDIFIIDSNKKVYYIEEAEITEVRVLSSLEKYILGETGIGRDTAEIMDDSKNFIDDENTTDVDESKYKNLLTFMSETSSDGVIYTVYMSDDSNIYKFNYLQGYDGAIRTIGNSEVKTIDIGETARIGKYVKYDGEKWIILYDDNLNGLQMISADALDSVELGFGDENFTEDEITEIDGVEGKSQLEISMHSYNNVVTTLNNICEESVTPKEGVILGVRSVGSNPISPNDDNPNEFITSDSTLPGYGTSTWFEDNLNLEKKVNEEGRTYYIIKNSNPEVEYKIKSNDSNYKADLDALVALEILNADNNSSYWLASRVLAFMSLGEQAAVQFSVRSSSNLDGSTDPMLVVVKEGDSSLTLTENPRYRIRPVVTIDSDILNGLITATETDSTLGNGETSETAWDLDAYLSANS